MLRYVLQFSDPTQHLLHVRLTVDAEACALAAPDQAPDRDWPATHALWMPVWTPGSYLVREYARHVEGLTVTDAADGTPVPWRKITKNRFGFAPPATTRRLAVRYSVYAHELTVRTADVTDDHAFWNHACVLLWPAGLDASAQASVEIELPAGWMLECPLAETAGGRTLRPATLEELVDAPCLAGGCVRVPFTAAGKPHEFVVDGARADELPPTLAADAARIVAAAAAVFGGEVPYERYSFLTILADGGRGGLEHAECSTLLASRAALRNRKGYEDFLGLVAHEFFHVWNVKRMRPAGLWSIDLERENYTELLWVAEGFTAYYDDHLCLRADVLTRERYLELIAENIADCLRTPGRHLHPLARASQDAWIKLYRPDENTRNSSQSYYVNGSLAALCLDLRIRAATDGARSLDDAMRDLFATTWSRGRGYTHEDVVASLSRAAGMDLAPAVHELTAGPFDPDFSALLVPFGLELQTSKGSPWLGVQLKSDVLVTTHIQRGGPAHAAGIHAADEILAIDGRRATSAVWSSLLESLPTGRALPVLLARRGKVLERQVTLEPNPHASLAIRPRHELTDRQRALCDRWLAVTHPRAAPA